MLLHLLELLLEGRSRMKWLVSANHHALQIVDSVFKSHNFHRLAQNFRVKLELLLIVGNLLLQAGDFLLYEQENIRLSHN